MQHNHKYYTIKQFIDQTTFTEPKKRKSLQIYDGRIHYKSKEVYKR